MMKFDFLIFGGTGQQGRICARDLLESGYSVLVAGRDNSSVKNLLRHKNAQFANIDLRNEKDIINLIEKSRASVVVNCAEFIFNVPIMKACLATKKSCTDLGGLQEITKEQFKLHAKFRKNNLVAITGCGSTPGILNVMVAHVVEDFDSVETINLGFAWNSNIKKFVVPYSIKSIFDELTKPPVVFENWRFIKSDRVRCAGEDNYRLVGKQTTYCIVHSEVFTFAKYFKNKGIKNIHYMAGFPEHSISVIKTLIDLGFNSAEPIEVQGISIKPRNFTTEVLKKIKIPRDYREVENLWANVEGKSNGKNKKVKINCLVKTGKGWEYAGSNVDTGRTISIMSQMLYNSLIKERGVFAPEAVIPHRLFIRELGKRKIYVYVNDKKIN